MNSRDSDQVLRSIQRGGVHGTHAQARYGRHLEEDVVSNTGVEVHLHDHRAGLRASAGAEGPGWDRYAQLDAERGTHRARMSGCPQRATVRALCERECV